MVRGRGQRGNHRGRRSHVISIPTGAKDISQKDDTYVCPISNFFCPLRDIGPHLPDNSVIQPLALFELFF